MLVNIFLLWFLLVLITTCVALFIWRDWSKIIFKVFSWAIAFAISFICFWQIVLREGNDALTDVAVLWVLALLVFLKLLWEALGIKTADPWIVVFRKTFSWVLAFIVAWVSFLINLPVLC